MRAFEIRHYSATVETRRKAAESANFDSSYYYPFDNFHNITSHVHPHFVICNIGLKMEKHLIEFFGTGSEIVQRDRVIKIAVGIFKKWTEDIPVELTFYREPHNPAAGDDDNNSTLIKEGRRDTSSHLLAHESTHSRKHACELVSAG